MLDEGRLNDLLGKLVGDLSAGYGGVMVSLGDKLGLYKAMAGAGPLSSHELAKRTGCAERYVREWLNSQAAGGYVTYHAGSATYELSPEESAKMSTVPGSLEEALDALEQDHDFLLKGGVFTQDLLDMWLSYKREAEIDPGEAAAIALWELHRDAVLLCDDMAARRHAESIGCAVAGTLGLVLWAARAGRLDVARARETLRTLPARTTLHIGAELLVHAIDSLDQG